MAGPARAIAAGLHEVRETDTTRDELREPSLDYNQMAALLAARPGVVFTRDQLLAEVWGWRDGSGHRTVDSHVRGLRRKLGAGWVRTVQGVGYALEPAEA
jgi:DNA-binding response OmpR family regulator